MQVATVELQTSELWTPVLLQILGQTEDGERQSHIENTTTNTTGRKRTAGNVAVHDVRFTARSYSRFPLFQAFEL